MRITFSRSGGFASFPGLMQPTTIDTASLPPSEAAGLERLVSDAHFAQLPPQVGSAPSGAADYRTYDITVQNEGRSHSVRVIEPIADPTLQALVHRLEQQRRTTRDT